MLLSWYIYNFGAFLVVIILPERKRKKKYSEMMKSLKVNDDIVTIGGIIGKVINIQDEYVIIQSGPDKTKLKFTKASIASVKLNNIVIKAPPVYIDNSR